MTIRVVLADDQQLIRAGLRLMLETEPDIRVVAEAEDGARAVEAAAALAPDLVLIDIRMPVLDGIEATRRLCGQDSSGHTSVLILTTYDADEYVFAALRAGASGFLLKHTSPEGLVAAIRTVAAGEGLIAPAVTRRLIAEFARAGAGGPPPVPLDSLTAREREVLALVGRGLTNGEIGRELYIGDATVKSHIGHIQTKLALRDRVHAVIYAHEAGLVPPGAARDLPLAGETRQNPRPRDAVPPARTDPWALDRIRRSEGS
jgi:DNA-binding NarL/FixJ family response regulator